MPGLKRLILNALEDQGFTLDNNNLSADFSQKDVIRRLHDTAVGHKRALARQYLAKREPKLLARFATGATITPDRIEPRLQLVRPDSEDELLFRYACLHWSIPISSGYGRRLRFLVIDEQNEKLIGLIGLGDPVFSLSARDAWIGWTHETRRAKLRHVMDAFVLGAVPPYSYLLGSKLVALLVASEEVRKAFGAKYGGTTSLIGATRFDGRLSLVTTTSALGRSSVYNRLRFDGRTVYQPVGWTRGSGEFHFSNGIYARMTEYAKEHFVPSAKRAEWGEGFRNRREVVKRCLSALKLPDSLLYHGVQRQVFVVPLARNSAEFLRGEHARLRWHSASCASITEYFKHRWMLPRARWDNTYREFDTRSLQLWADEPR